MDARFAPFIGKYIGLPASLQRLAVSYVGHSTSASPLLPNLSHLTQLKSLKLEAPDIHKDALVNSLAKCPETLTSCYVGRWGNYGMNIPFYLEVYQPIQAHLRRLTNLDPHFCWVHTPKGSITCLEGLTSLSITDSEVELDFDDVTKLTNLISLDLTDTYAPEHLYNRMQPEKTSSHGAALRHGLACMCSKFAVCWLIVDSTVMDVL